MGQFKIVVNHGFGFSTEYTRLDKVSVSKGDIVLQNQKIGIYGCTGLCAGPHLHFSLKVNGKSVNPQEDSITRLLSSN